MPHGLDLDSKSDTFVDVWIENKLPLSSSKIRWIHISINQGAGQ